MPKINFTIKELEYIYNQTDVDVDRVIFSKIEQKIRKVVPRYREFDKKAKKGFIK